MNKCLCYPKDTDQSRYWFPNKLFRLKLFGVLQNYKRYRINHSHSSRWKIFITYDTMNLTKSITVWRPRCILLVEKFGNELKINYSKSTFCFINFFYWTLSYTFAGSSIRFHWSATERGLAFFRVAHHHKFNFSQSKQFEKLLVIVKFKFEYLIHVLCTHRIYWYRQN